jgi:hypothetical protein
MHPTINDAELQLLQCVTSGDVCDLKLETGARPDTEIRAELIRHLMLGLPVETEQGPVVQRNLAGVRIKGAIIEGSLNLADCTCVGSAPLPALVLESCTITDVIDISCTHIQRVSLRDSRIRHLYANAAYIDGPLDLEGVTSSEEAEPTGAFGDARCWVELKDAFIDGDLFAGRASLCAPPIRKNFVPGTVPAQFALDLAGAIITGSLILQPRFHANGGVSLRGAEIRGDLWAAAAELRETELYALHAQRATIGGHVFMGGNNTDPFWSMGTISWMTARIHGYLNMSNVVIQPTDRQEGYALIGSGMQVGGDTTITGALGGSVFLNNAEVKGDLRLGFGDSHLRMSTHLEPRRHKDDDRRRAISTGGLSLRNSRIDRNLIVHAFAFDSPRRTLRSIIDKEDVKWGRRRPLQCYPGWQLVEITCETANGRGVVALLTRGVDHAIVLDGRSYAFWRLNDDGQLQLNNAAAAAEYLKLFSTYLISKYAGPFYIVTNAGNAGAKLKAQLAEDTIDVVIEQQLDKYQAQASVVHDGVLFRCEFSIERNGMVSMLQDEAKRYVKTSTVFMSPFRLEMGSAGGDGSLQMPSTFDDGYQQIGQDEAESFLRLALKHQPYEHHDIVRPTIDLTGLHVEALDDLRGTGWGSTAALSLIGFNYNRLVHFASTSEDARVKEEFYLQRDRSVTRRLLYPLLWLVRMPLRAVERMAVSALAALGWRWQVTRQKLLFSWSKVPQPPRPPFSAGGSWKELAQRLRSDLFGRRAEPESSGLGWADDWKWRLNWLSLQYASFLPSYSEYHPQPYEQLASAYRAGGLTNDARRVLSEKLTIERKHRTHAALKPFLWLSWLLFDYGLSPRRALLTLTAFIAIGWVAVRFANGPAGLMVIDAAPTQTVVAEDGRVGSPVVPRAGTISELPCGGAISPLLYATDVFIPLLDLREEPRCQVRSFSSADAARWRAVETQGGLQLQNVSVYRAALLADPRAWLIAKAIYAIAGWIIVSLTILTVSGVLRHQIER